MLDLIRLFLTRRVIKSSVHVYYAETCIGKSYARHQILARLPHDRSVRKAIAIVDHDFLHLKDQPVKLLRYLFDVVQYSARHVFIFSNSTRFLRLATFVGCDVRFIATYPGDPAGYTLMQQRWGSRHEGAICHTTYDNFVSHVSDALSVADELNEDRILPTFAVPFTVRDDSMANTASDLMVQDVIAFVTSNLGVKNG